MAKKCKHLDQIKITTTDIHVCEECVKMGDTWVHLRLCMAVSYTHLDVYKRQVHYL